MTPVATAPRLTPVGTAVRLTPVATDGAKSRRGVLTLAARARAANQVGASSSGGPTSTGAPGGMRATVPEGSRGRWGAARRLPVCTRATVPEGSRGRRGAAQRLAAGTPAAGTPEGEATPKGRPVGKVRAHGETPVKHPPLAGVPETAEQSAGVATGRTVVFGMAAATLAGTPATTRGDQRRVVRYPRVGAALLVTVYENWITTAGRRPRFGPELRSGRAQSLGDPRARPTPSPSYVTRLPMDPPLRATVEAGRRPSLRLCRRLAVPAEARNLLDRKPGRRRTGRLPANA